MNIFCNFIFFLAQLWFVIILIIEYKNCKKKESEEEEEECSYKSDIIRDIVNNSSIIIFICFIIFITFKTYYYYNPTYTLYKKILFLLSLCMINILCIVILHNLITHLNDHKNILLI